jgi:ABC-type phosphate transport system substrate-binding protein
VWAFRDLEILREVVVMKVIFAIAAVAAIMMMVQVAPSIAESDSSEYVIVVNKTLPSTSINVAALKGIYLREVKTWKHSESEIVPVDLATADNFYMNLFGKSYTQMQTYWMKMRINYSINMPISKKDPESVKQFIATNKDAIGFLKNSDVDDRVKVLKLVN